MEIPDSLQSVPITFEDLPKAQQNDEKVREVCRRLGADGNEAVKKSKHYEVIDGVLYRKTAFGEKNDGSGMSRVYVPESLRITVLHNAHNYVWGAHRNAVAALKDIVVKYYWPGMDDQYQKFVSNCENCQLAKGLRPSRQGFLSGCKHNKVGNQTCMDLIGPISAGASGHVKHKEPTYIFVITDPFSHMLWLSCISGKSAEEVYIKL